MMKFLRQGEEFCRILEVLGFCGMMIRFFLRQIIRSRIEKDLEGIKVDVKRLVKGDESFRIGLGGCRMRGIFVQEKGDMYEFIKS